MKRKKVNEQHKDSLTVGEKISLYITSKVGTIGCAIFFAIIAFISLPSVIASHDALIIVGWVAQTFLQLVLLPVILLGQNLQSRHSEYLAEATYENDIDMHNDVDIIKSEIQKMSKDIKKLIDKN